MSKDEFDLMLEEDMLESQEPDDEVEPDEEPDDEVDEDSEEDEPAEEAESDSDEVDSDEEDSEDSEDEDDLDELSYLKEQNTELRNQLLKFSENYFQSAQEPEKDKAQKDSFYKVEPKEEGKKDDKFSFLGDYSLDDFVDSPEVFETVMLRAVQKAREETIREVLTNIPQLVIKQINDNAERAKKVEKFFADNKDLSDVKPLVAMVAEQVMKEQPGIDEAGLMQEAAIRTRKVLGLRNAPREEKKPAFAKQKKRTKKSAPPKLSKLQRDIDSMLNSED